MFAAPYAHWLSAFGAKVQDTARSATQDGKAHVNVHFWTNLPYARRTTALYGFSGVSLCSSCRMIIYGSVSDTRNSSPCATLNSVTSLSSSAAVRREPLSRHRAHTVLSSDRHTEAQDDCSVAIALKYRSMARRDQRCTVCPAWVSGRSTLFHGISNHASKHLRCQTLPVRSQHRETELTHAHG